MYQAPKTSTSRCGTTKTHNHEEKFVISSQKHFNFHFFPINLNEASFQDSVDFLLMVDEKDCFRVSYFSGPLTIVIVLLAFEDITFFSSLK